MKARLLAGVAGVLALIVTALPAHAAPDTPGAFCDTEGARSETTAGTPLVCTAEANDPRRWREVGAPSTPAVDGTTEPSATPSATPSTTPSGTPSARTTPKPSSGTVTATYGCGQATFHNNTDVPVRVLYGTAQTDDVEGKAQIGPGKSKTVKSNNTAFGWTATDNTGTDRGHEWLPGKDLNCDDTTVPPGKTPKPEKRRPNNPRGLANTGH